MKYRKLRIAWSVAWGIVAMLIVALWMRSYWWEDVLTKSIDFRRALMVSSYKGEFVLYITKPPTYVPGWHWQSKGASGKNPTSGFHYSHWSEYVTITFPQLFVVAMIATIAGVPWMRKFRTRSFNRFSIRTLLIATTLIAILLGLIVWLAR